METDKPLCFCFDVTEADIRHHFIDEKGTFEDLVEKTKIGTKCTACLLDLDMALESIHKGRSEMIWAEDEEISTRSGIFTTEDFTDSAFFICDQEIATHIRLANMGQLFLKESANVPFAYGLLIFSETGELVARQKGRVALQGDVEINFHDIPDCPERGWFLLTLRPQAEGLFGTMRPQIALQGKDWRSTFHSQPHMMATKQKYRNSVTIISGEEALGASVSVINAEKKDTVIDFHLTDPNGTYEHTARQNLPPLGSRIYRLDDMFPDAPCGEALILSVISDQPTRKHIMNHHADGSMSVDHFPN